ncbi:MAG: tRNA-dihydrouridine synthase family protein [Planctomycetia bacterium]|nr:tRNA-dihydrouridine synthase family protein [Planctomycetia bacterium]
MKIGRIAVAHPFLLAPMEEHTNFPFRMQMKKHGAALVCTERVDGADVAARDRRALRLLYTMPGESPRVGQISGREPAMMAEAARVVEEHHFDGVDLNFECPIRRLVGRGEGGALLGDPPAIGAIVEAVVRAVSIPVTLKIRSGPDAATETAVEVTQRAEQAGASAVEVHCRSVQQAYVGGPDWQVVARAKQAATIPVFGSGGVREAADAVRFLRESGADGVGIGRGCLGNPWLFAQCRALWLGGSMPKPPSAQERGRAALEIFEEEIKIYGQALALRRLPRVSCYYAKFVADFAGFKTAVQKVRNTADFRTLVRTHFV